MARIRYAGYRGAGNANGLCFERQSHWPCGRGRNGLCLRAAACAGEVPSIAPKEEESEADRPDTGEESSIIPNNFQIGVL